MDPARIKRSSATASVPPVKSVLAVLSGDAVSFFGGIAIKEYLQAEELKAAVHASNDGSQDDQGARKRAAALRLERSAQARIAACVHTLNTADGF